MTAPTAELDHLAVDLKNGKTEAYRELVQLMGETLQRYAHRIMGDSGKAQDVVQDALLRIYRYRKRLDVSTGVRGLCFRTVRNLARNAIRDTNLRRQREQEAEEMRNSNLDQPAELANTAWNFAEQLPRELKEVVELRFAFGLSRAEIAETLQLPEGTVATRQRTALATIKEKLTALSVAPAGLAPSQLANAIRTGGEASMSHPYPTNIIGMEEIIMAGIRRMKMKTAGIAASAALITILILSVTAVTVHGSLSNPAPTSAANGHTIAKDTGNSATHQPAGLPGAKREHSPANDSDANSDAEEVNSPSSSPTTSNQVLPNKPETTGDIKPEGSPNAPPQDQPEAIAPLATTGTPPGFDSEAVLSAAAGKVYMYMIITRGDPRPEISAENLPKWLTLEGDILHGTPTIADLGATGPITLTADNGNRRTAQQRFSILVTDAPKITSEAPTRAYADKKFEYEIVVEATPEANVFVEGLPDWLEFADGKLTGKPKYEHCASTAEITITATNGSLPDAEQKITLEVFGAPKFVSKPIKSVELFEEYRYNVEVLGHPKPFLTAADAPKWLIVGKDDVVGRPGLFDKGDDAKFTLKASNGIDPSDEQVVQVEIVPNPRAINVPWEKGDFFDFYREGASVTWTNNRSTAVGGRVGDKETVVVTGNSETGYSAEYTRQDVDTSGGRAVYKEGETRSVEYSWENVLILGTSNYIVPEGYEIEEGKAEKLEIDGQKYSAIPFTIYQVTPTGRKTGTRYWALKDLPIYAKVEILGSTEAEPDKLIVTSTFVVTEIVKPKKNRRK